MAMQGLQGFEMTPEVRPVMLKFGNNANSFPIQGFAHVRITLFAWVFGLQSCRFGCAQTDSWRQTETDGDRHRHKDRQMLSSHL